MMNHLVRTTTYFHNRILTQAKKMAIDEGKSFYEFINDTLTEALAINKEKSQTYPRTFHYEDEYTVVPLKMVKKEIRREDAYE